MDTLRLVTSIALGLVMCAAGASKIRMGKAWIAQGRELGAPPAVLPIVPWIEIAIGALLIAQVATAVVAIFALVVLQLFTLLLIVNLGRGHRPPCACFGAWSAKPLGWGHVARNVVFMVFAVLAYIGAIT
ncbi:MAG: MauE/DoxX family redox-associated membrane protein [Ilumatobacteraceae bacterium]